MKIQDLNQINKESAFQEARMSALKPLLLLITLVSIGILLLLQLFDQYATISPDQGFVWLCLSFSAAFLLNYTLASLRQTLKAYKQHLTIGFYLGTLLCSILVGMTQAIQSPYWFSLFFVLIAWFILVPYTYRELILHSLLFFALFLNGVHFQTTLPVFEPTIFKMALLYAGILAMGCYSAYTRNNVEAKNYLSNKALALKNKELSKFRLVLEQAPGSVIIMDKEMNFEYINPVFSQLSGYTREDLLNKNIKDTIYRGETPDSRIEVARSLQMGEPWQGELLTYHKTGKSYWANTIASPYKDESGIVEGYIVIQQDVSGQVELQEALKRSESRYKTLVENSQDGIFAIVGDKVQFVNNTICKMLGYSAEELYNMPAINMIIPEDRERGLEISQRRLNGDWSTVNGIFHFQAKDGTIRECDTYSSILELNGQIVSYITVHDLTENRRMQEKLQQSEAKYRTVIENATDGIVITQQGKLRFLNKSMWEMMQYAEDEIIEKPFLDYVMAEDQQLMIDFHKRRMAGEDFSSLYRSHLIRKDGKIITVELNARTSFYNGEPAAFIIIRDISNREKIENELQTAKQNLEKLNRELEQRIIESSESLTEARTQLINLQKENLQSQFDVLKQQVNPHFLFNSLNVLTSLIKLEPDLAEKFTEHLSKVYRYVLENKDNELVKLTTELDFLDAYIFLLNIRFMGKLVVNIRIPEEMRNCLVIPLAMQLLIENAIKHNAMSKKSPLVIDVFIDENHFLNIINNLQEREAHMASTGVGLKNIQNRYLLLNNSAPEFEKTPTHFIARIPLICDQNS